MNEVLKRDGLNLIISPCPPHEETTPQNATQLARTDANLVLEPCAYTFRCAVHTICSSPKAPGNPERGPGNTSISSVRNFTMFPLSMHLMASADGIPSSSGMPF